MMRVIGIAGLALTLFLTIALLDAQGDPDRVIPGGGIHVAGWMGVIDASSIKQGRSLNDARFAQEGNALHVTTGPAATYWNPANTAAGDYTVRATFLEPRFMNLNSHPHSYGLFIGGSSMGTDKMSLVYCVTYGDGTMLVRGFAPAVFTLLRASPHAAVHKAAGVEQPVTQEIAWRVRGNRAECVINGMVAAGYDKSELLAAGKLQSTDGVFGLRFTHNVEAIVTGFGVTKG
jgi:hypothetical protein